MKTTVLNNIGEMLFEKRERRQLIQLVQNTEYNEDQIQEIIEKSNTKVSRDPNDNRVLHETNRGNFVRTIAREDYLVGIVDGELRGYETLNDAQKELKYVGLFTKDQRSSFPYWFAHWCAFQMTALNLGVWKFRFLFHDAAKPWRRLIFGKKNYETKVRNHHREHARHHLMYGQLHGWDKVDWLALAIDWECGKYTKVAAQADCRETMESRICPGGHYEKYEKEIRLHLEQVMEDLGI